MRSTSDEHLRNLDAIVAAQARYPHVGEFVAIWTDAERRRFRQGFEAVDRVRAALDATNVIGFAARPAAAEG